MQRSRHHSQSATATGETTYRAPLCARIRARAAAGVVCATAALALTVACTERVTDPAAPGTGPLSQVVFDGELTTLAWQQTARDLVVKYRHDPLAATRDYALLSVA